MLKNATPLVIIGGGNMGAALAKGWRAQGLQHGDMVLVEPNAQKREELQAKQCRAVASLSEIDYAPRVTVLAIKPQSFHATSAGLEAWLANKDMLLISIMAGTPIAAIQKIAPSARIARVMPNTPSIVGQGMSVACAPALGEDDSSLVSTLFGCVGKVAWLKDEEKMHAATAISGSGPAYFFAFMDALRHAAIDMGLGESLADLLVRQTALGAATQASESLDALEALQDSVTSPGGTTAAALEKLLDDGEGLRKLLGFATLAAEARSRSLASE